MFRQYTLELRRIGRSIIYDNDFKIAKTLGKNGFQRISDVLSGVIRRNYDAYDRQRILARGYICKGRGHNSQKKLLQGKNKRSEERRVGKECRSRRMTYD